MCLVLKQYSNIYFCNYHSFIILENIMENTGTVHRWQTAPSPGAITTVEVNLKRTFSSGEWEKRVAIKDCYNCGKSGHLADVCPSKYKVATKTDKKDERNYTNCYHLLFNLIIYFIFANCSTDTNLIK